MITVSHITIERVREVDKARLPLFEEMEKTFEEIRRRAFGLFEQRGALPGRDLDDWFRAERELL